ncbi:hypothetical protein SADUNF_Sadunf05G0198400 [Salix dunnii]|uniref:Uncharacterized protein n=1 Tax=Salix dunnii TaxID=1413687 RepID=A0A835MZZ1_9ROSI|nr:hypothetical protein SADUNF_Sadunf05G0198400 [Salix dunnii]
MDEHDSEDPKRSTVDMTVFVQHLLQRMQSSFQTILDSIVSKIEEMGNRDAHQMPKLPLDMSLSFEQSETESAGTTSASLNSEMLIFLQVHFASHCTAISGVVVLELHEPSYNVTISILESSSNISTWPNHYS